MNSELIASEKRDVEDETTLLAQNRNIIKRRDQEMRNQKLDRTKDMNRTSQMSCNLHQGVFRVQPSIEGFKQQWKWKKESIIKQAEQEKNEKAIDRSL